MSPTSPLARGILALVAIVTLAQWPAAHAQAGRERVAGPVRMAVPDTRSSPAPAPVRPALRFAWPRATVASAPDIATTTIPAAGSSITIPYIQTQPDLRFVLDASHLAPDAEVVVTLDAATPSALSQVFESGPYAGTFTGVGFGEHTLTAAAVEPRTEAGPQRTVAEAELRQVARGSIVAAMGDSTTEGLGGPFVGTYSNWVEARQAVPSLVSADGRNYPQPGQVEHPRAHVSFTVELGERLADAWRRPVFVLNLGWSGATADGFTHIADSQYLANVFGAALPDAYVIDLGVNDALVGRPPDEYGARVQGIVSSLEQRYGATGGQIHLACPVWSAQPRRQALETQYMPVLAQVRAADQLASAPDFFGYYGAHRDEVADKVHPNAAGYSAMAELWAASLQGQDLGC